MPSLPRYRHALPQLDNGLFMTDGGLETTLIFEDGIDLPAFAAFDLLKSDAGTQVLRRYFERYASLAAAHGVGIVLESPTWRANPDWGKRLGYDAAALATANRRAIALLAVTREAFEKPGTPIVISGNVGPRGDGYRAVASMDSAEARDYHEAQIATFAQSGADMVAAFTMTYAEEAIGVVHAAKAHAMPAAISFTVETDGRLPSGESLGDAIAKTDATTGAYPAYYMINCAHPSHFDAVLEADAPWCRRIRGLRANASSKSHAELDACTEIDVGDWDELARHYVRLKQRLPGLCVVGGCCGTDHRHVGAICGALASRTSPVHAI